MNIKENERERQKKLYEYITTTHMFCILIMLSALVLNHNLFTNENMINRTAYVFFNIRFFLLIALLGMIIILSYNTRGRSPAKGYPLTWVDLLYVSFSLLIAILTLLIVENNSLHLEVIFLLPIIMTASILGKIPGLMIATVCTGILFVDNIANHMGESIFNILESHLILISIMYIVGWFIGSRTDLDNQYREELTKTANTDVLTDLYNHRYFQEKLQEYFNLVSEEKPLSLIMMDIDYFKHYNDCYGHLAGDHVLSVIGKILNQIAKESGFAARYGGEEFAVVLPDCDSKRAVQIAEKVRAQVDMQSFPGEEHQPDGKITMSCGIATCPTHANSIKDLIKSADQALYRAKSINKNKVELYFSVFEKLEIEESEQDLLNSIHTLISVINAKDRYTYGHSERVTHYSIKLAKKMGLPEMEVELLKYAAFLHDIGKIEIGREVLNKKESLTGEEWNILKQHPKWGSDIVKAIKKLQPAATIILYHHENYNGSGYPAGIKGEDIPLLSRIIRVADSYDAMVSNRPYKKNMSAVEALEEIDRCSGTMFDPTIAAEFICMMKSENVKDISISCN